MGVRGQPSSPALCGRGGGRAQMGGKGPQGVGEPFPGLEQILGVFLPGSESSWFCGRSHAGKLLCASPGSLLEETPKVVLQRTH